MRNEIQTADSMYLDIMLAKIPEKERAKRVSTLAQAVRHANGDECPHCGCTSIEDNGDSPSQVVYRCDGCGHRFGPGTRS